jgi:hypothetical protein
MHQNGDLVIGEGRQLIDYPVLHASPVVAVQDTAHLLEVLPSSSPAVTYKHAGPERRAGRAPPLRTIAHPCFLGGAARSLGTGAVLCCGRSRHLPCYPHAFIVLLRDPSVKLIKSANRR